MKAELFSAILAFFAGDLGGQLGLFIGVSVLTVCELFETIILGCARCVNRKKRNRVIQAWGDAVQQAQTQNRFQMA